mmetsp:Transcript_10461/g.17208  ORF Transcript_10461/g.17208 Transcript_10461/m.17208 type:complete len:90 (-) Transcript_10461:369-638(-)
MGANVNMDGTAIGFPCMILFLAYSVQIEDSITAFTWFNVAIASSLGSVGTAPVPAAGIILRRRPWFSFIIVLKFKALMWCPNGDDVCLH